MSLDVTLTAIRPTTVHEANITHNMTEMARESGLYMYLWQPDALGIKTAQELIAPLRDGLALLKSDPERFKVFNPPNGWGSYEGLVKFVFEYMQACIENPDATVEASR